MDESVTLAVSEIEAADGSEVGSTACGCDVWGLQISRKRDKAGSSGEELIDRWCFKLVHLLAVLSA
jgi:hypothetical protein